jgi:hypothetical protein
VLLGDRLEPVDDAAVEVAAHLGGQGGVVVGRDLRVVQRGVAGARGIDAEHEDRARERGLVGGAAVDREGRAHGDVASLRQLGLGERGVARPGRWRGEHAVGEVLAALPLRARRDLERAHVGRGVDRGQVEGERGQLPLGVGLGRRREVAVPWLVLGAGERDIEAELHDLVVGAQDRLAHAGDPRVADQVDEAAQRLGVHLDVEAMRAAADRAAWPGRGLRKRGVNVLAHRGRPRQRERTPQRADAAAVEVGAGLRNLHSDGCRLHASSLASDRAYASAARPARLLTRLR